MYTSVRDDEQLIVMVLCANPSLGQKKKYFSTLGLGTLSTFFGQLGLDLVQASVGFQHRIKDKGLAKKERGWRQPTPG